METKIVKINKEIKKCTALKKVVWQRTANAEEWIEKHASGTLNKNKRLGMTWRSQYLEERIAYQYGWDFEIQPRSRIMFGDAFTEGDESAVTEAGWHIERYIETAVFPEDHYECKYINVEYAHGEKREGIGILIRETSAQWIPKGHIIFAIVAEFDTETGEWKEAVNPF